jgi:arginase family enzyme
VGAARLALIGAPTSAGAFAPGQEQAPRALRDAGLLDALRDAGAEDGTTMAIFAERLVATLAGIGASPG